MHVGLANDTVGQARGLPREMQLALWNQHIPSGSIFNWGQANIEFQMTNKNEMQSTKYETNS
jgi:hypothetical protein